MRRLGIVRAGLLSLVWASGCASVGGDEASDAGARDSGSAFGFDLSPGLGDAAAPSDASSSVDAAAAADAALDASLSDATPDGAASAPDAAPDAPVARPRCADGADDDGDGQIDFPDDLGCESAEDPSEDGPCAESPVTAVDGAAPIDGDLAGAPALTVGTCGGAAGGERVFRYRVERPLDRLIFDTRHPETVAPVVLYVRRPCDAESEVACNRGNEAQPGTALTIERPALGDYFVFVDTGSRMAVGGFRLTIEAEVTPACRNEIDDDGDARVDAADPGCAERQDADEADPDAAPVCANGDDDDGDGLVDHPLDPDCAFAGGDRESPVCPGAPPVVPVDPAGGRYDLPPIMGAGASNGQCDASVGAEVVLQIDLGRASDVAVRVEEGGAPAALTMHARRDCHDPASEVGCVSARPGAELRLPALAAGTWFVFVETGFVPPPGPRVAVVTVESIVGECNDEVDNDRDGFVDLGDPGCAQLRDDSEADPGARPECANGADDDGDGLTDWPDDTGCVAAGDPREGGCDGHPQWRPVECVAMSWVWSSDRAFRDVASANANRALWSGCLHAEDNAEGLCSLDGAGWVAVEADVMQGCDASWFHLGGRHTGECGGHDGDTVRRLVLGEDDCYDY